jgi:hypothetical protein
MQNGLEMEGEENFMDVQDFHLVNTNPYIKADSGHLGAFFERS